MRTADFDFHLPEELIAQEPALPRGTSRLLALERATGRVVDGRFGDLAAYLAPGDLLVVNDSRVLPARLMGRRATGGRVELLLVRDEGEGRWEALTRSSKRLRPGEAVLIDGEEARAVILEERGGGSCLVRLEGSQEAGLLIERLGRMPLPPYIRREKPREEDREWYQTVYSRPEKTGSVAAPTAGLHFSDELLDSLRKKGVEVAPVTLHVGPGTFQPVRAEEVAGHRMHSESFEVSPETADAVNRALEEGRRVVAVGTTATRVLEHAGREGFIRAGAGETAIFITPGFRFRIVGALLTNFHLPQSTLVMLVAAFAGLDVTLAAYRHAVEARYRFYSYGDAMFIY